MTQLLEQALTALRQLSDAEQDAIAALIIDEMADERRWDESFARSSSGLSALVDKARQDIQQGRVRSVGWDEL
jgi:hypothetical protein